MTNIKIDAAATGASTQLSEPTGVDKDVQISEAPTDGTVTENSTSEALGELLERAESVPDQAPNSYTTWRTRADILITTIRKLERREIEADSNIKVFGVPILERDLRDAAEKALRHCAHFANTFDERISLVDAANEIRNISWF